MPECGSQCWLCDLPIRFDTYKGCTHNCKYCFVQRKSSLDVKKGEGLKALKDFLNGKRTLNTGWCDWDIPLHWGGMSDPFQPCEKKYKYSLEALKVFAETQYPVIISTKGKLCIEQPYLDLIKKCNAVMQISCLCSKYDELEKGAPTFEERLHIIDVLSKNCKRVIVRAQPYVHDVFKDMMDNIPKFSEAGAYGIIFEGMKFVKKKNGLVKCGGDYVQPYNVIKKDFERLKKQCHKYGLKFYSGENRLRSMGDSLTCCGIDGLDGFVPNKYNLNHILNGDIQEPSPAQKLKGKARCFVATLGQDTESNQIAEKLSFEELIKYLYNKKRNHVNEVLTKKGN